MFRAFQTFKRFEPGLSPVEQPDRVLRAESKTRRFGPVHDAFRAAEDYAFWSRLGGERDWHEVNGVRSVGRRSSASISNEPSRVWRTMMKTNFAAAACLALMAFATMSGADIAGKWTTTIDTMIGALKYTYEFKVDGTKLTGTATLDGEAAEITEGKLDGDAISFVETRTLGDLGPTRILYTGKIVSADQIDFKRQVGDLATEEFVAKRAK